MSDVDTRVAAAERLIRERGIPGAVVRAAGHRAEIAAVEVPRDAIAALAALAPEIKALGFRYVALELIPDASEVAATVRDS